MKQRFNLYTLTPEGTAALINVETYIKSCGLEHSLLHLIKTRVSQMNGCAFCIHMHTKEARADGESDIRLHLLNAWEESALYTPRERAALAWAEALTDIRTSHANDAVYEETRAHFNERELADLTMAVGMINLWNRLAVGARSVHTNDRAPAKAAG